MTPIDLRLLRIFDEIYKCRSVTEAGEKIGLSQPSISIALGRLRRHFDDPLFVRTSAGMAATPRADALIAPVREVLGLIDSALGQPAAFDPLLSDRTFRISMTDISVTVLLPTLLDYLSTHAPQVRIGIANISQDTPKMLESGDADIALGFMPQLDAGFYQQKLFRQTFACIAGVHHPRIGNRLSQKQFSSERHMVVTTSGTGHYIVDRILEQQKVHRAIALWVPSFLGIGDIIASTDLLATVPRLLAEVLSKDGQIKVLETPVRLPSYSVKQHWHQRFHHDRGNQWLRGVIADLFLEVRGRIGFVPGRKRRNA